MTPLQGGNSSKVSDTLLGQPSILLHGAPRPDRSSGQPSNGDQRCRPGKSARGCAPFPVPAGRLISREAPFGFGCEADPPRLGPCGAGATGNRAAAPFAGISLPYLPQRGGANSPIAPITSDHCQMQLTRRPGPSSCRSLELSQGNYPTRLLTPTDHRQRRRQQHRNRNGTAAFSV